MSNTGETTPFKMVRRPTMYQHLCCANDARGEAREVYVFYDAQGGIVAVEPKRGAWAAWDMARKLIPLPSIETYPAERRALLKEWPRLEP